MFLNNRSTDILSPTEFFEFSNTIAGHVCQWNTLWAKSVDRLPTEIAKRIKNVYDRPVLMTGLFFDPACDGWQAVPF